MEASEILTYYETVCYSHLNLLLSLGYGKQKKHVGWNGTCAIATYL